MKPIYAFCIILVSMSSFLSSCGVRDDTSQPPFSTLTMSPLVNTPLAVPVTPSRTDQPTQVPTVTPIATLSEQEAFTTFVNLIEKDSECNLPCWLGVRPGQTQFEDVKNMFSKFSTIASIDFSPDTAYIRLFFPDFETAVHDIVTEVTPANTGQVLTVLIRAGIDPKGIHENINYNQPEFQKMWQRFFMPGIFTEYGPPEEVFLDTTLLTVDPASSYPFVLWIIYPRQGFLIRYEGKNIETGSNIRICPMQSSIEIKTWDIDELRYEEFMKGDSALASPFSLGPQPIEDVTEFSVESFYERFRSGTIDTCFETPASLWPPNK